MATTCDCTGQSNTLTDLEAAELSIQITGYIIKGLLPDKYETASYLVDHLLSVPDLAVKFADTVVKSTKSGSIEWSEVEEIFGAAATLVGTLGLLAGVANPWVNTVDFAQSSYFLIKDFLDSDSPLRSAINQLAEGKKEALTITGDNNANIIVGDRLGDTLNGMGGNDTINGGCGNDRIFGGTGNDVLYGEGCDDYINGGTGSDTLVGGTGSDGLVGGAGNDTLIGTNGYGGDDGVWDTLNGGAGFDTYISGNNDVIYDSDGKGMIVFEGRVLHGVDVTMDSTIYPSGQDHTAYYSKADKGTYYRNGNYGFSFVADGTNHTITVYSPLDYTEKIVPKPGGGTMTQKTYRGVGVILENFSSPLVLDLNHDGVTSLDLYATPAYFDMENDGIREKTGWIQSTDALLAFDKNQDGIINDGSELFGNYTTLANGTKASNGFEALAQYDNNHDSVIDKNDSVYNVLSAWIDTNQDGVTDTGELHSLSELGVTSINLNATATTTYEDQNAITHTSSFTQQTTDAEGNVVVWFDRYIKDTKVFLTAQIQDEIKLLDNIKGSRYEKKSFYGGVKNVA